MSKLQFTILTICCSITSVAVGFVVFVAIDGLTGPLERLAAHAEQRARERRRQNVNVPGSFAGSPVRGVPNR